MNLSTYSVCNLFFTLFICQNLFSLSDEVLRRAHAHILVSDPKSACQELGLYFEQEKEDKKFLETYIEALSEAGDEKRLIQVFQQVLIKFPDLLENKKMLENLSWGVIKNAADSDAPMIRLFSLLAACFANDAKGIKIVEKRLRDNNSLLRGAAIKLSASLPDLKIQNELLRLMKEEPLFLIRLEAIKALGNSKYPHIKEELEKRLLNGNLEHEEKALAIQSLVHISEKAKRQEIELLSKSVRAERRLLAAEFVQSQELLEDVDLIVPLLSDNRREVRKAALETIGSLRIKDINGQNISLKIEPLLNDLDQTVAITAAWALSLNQEPVGKKALKGFLNHPLKEIQLISSSAIANLGSCGIPLMKQAFLESSDPLIKMNLAIGLIGQRQLLEEASNALYEGLIKIKKPLKWVENGLFKYLATSEGQEAESIPDERQAKNQLARLEIVNILSILNDPKAENALKTFLQQNTWGISAMASLLLLSEADESAISLVENLLDDKNKKVRVQAALILSLWDSDANALFVLQDFYPQADREMKERILEGIGRIGSSASIPFLVECLKEPFQSLRVIAASSLLQVLYH